MADIVVSSGQSIQAAINSAWDGASIEVREGTYVGTVTVNKRVHIYGVGNVVIDGQAGVSSLNGGYPEGNWSPTTARDGKRFSWNTLVSIEASGTIFENFHVTRSMGRGVRVWSPTGYIENVTLRNVHVSWSRQTGILGYIRGQNLLIEDCEVEHANSFAEYTRPSSEADWGACLSTRDWNGVIVRRTKVHDSYCEGLLVDSTNGNSSNITVEDCDFWNCWRAGIYLHGFTTGTVTGNLVYTTPGFPNYGGIVLTPTEPQFATGRNLSNILLENNIAVGNNTNFAVWGSPGRWLENIQVRNNTFVNSVGGSNIYYAGERTDKNCIFADNVSYHNSNNHYNSSWVGMWTQSGTVYNPTLPDPNHILVGGEVQREWYLPGYEPPPPPPPPEPKVKIVVWKLPQEWASDDERAPAAFLAGWDPYKRTITASHDDLMWMLSNPDASADSYAVIVAPYLPSQITTTDLLDAAGISWVDAGI